MGSHTAEDVLRDPGYGALKTWIVEWTGLGYWCDKDQALADRLARVLDAAPGIDCGTYLGQLAGEPPAGPRHRTLLAEVTVGETYFFRFAEQFDALRNDVLPHCLQRNRAHRGLRIWSAGCSNGAEPYSLAILLHEMGDFADWDVRIVATDLSPGQLEAARRAEFTDWSLRDVPPARRHLCFDRHGTLWRLKPAFRSAVEFHRHNLAEDGPPPGAPFDIILCRNVLIYFSEGSRDRALGLLDRSLREGGWLLFGHAEGAVEAAGRFTPVRFPEATLFRKPGPERRAAPPRLPRPRAGPPPPAPAPAPAPPRQSGVAERLADGGEWRRLLDEAVEWMEQEPLEPLPHYYQGLALFHLGSGDAASAYRRALYLDRTFALAHFQLARLRLDHGDADAAARHFRNVAALTGRMPEGRPVLAGGSLTGGELRVIALRWLEKLTEG